MKILYVTWQTPWPANAGVRIRNYNILKLLARKHQVTAALLHSGRETIANFMNDPTRLVEGRTVADEKASFSRYVYGRSLQRQRPLFRQDDCGTYRTGIETLLKEESPDLVWYFRMASAWYARGASCHAPVVCDVDDFESKTYWRLIQRLPFWKRVHATLDYPGFVRAERDIARRCNVLLVSNPLDTDVVAKKTGVKTFCLPNGFDFTQPPSLQERRGKHIAFIGILRYPPNLDGIQWFIREVWPHLRRRAPGVQLDIAGDYCGKEATVRELARAEGVTFHGFVDDLSQLTDRAACLIVPLLVGGGTRIKILEAWAHGLPVVSTSVGSEGLGAVPNSTALIADNAEEFAEACGSLLSHPETGRIMAEDAYNYGKANFDWSCRETIIEDVLLAAMGDVVLASN